MAAIDPNRALIFLQTNNPYLTPQQYKTLRGQVLAGDPAGAMKGLQNILETRRRDRENFTCKRG